MQYKKYSVVRICPVRKYGPSAGRAAIHVTKITCICYCILFAVFRKK